MRVYWIYTLRDPDSYRVRYVGKTHLSLYKRLRFHINDSKRNKTYCNKWVQSILKNNKEPLIQPIQIVCEKTWPEKEKYWIKFYKESGSQLVNITEGGIGYISPVKHPRKKRIITPEERAKMEAGKKKYYQDRPELCKKLGEHLQSYATKITKEQWLEIANRNKKIPKEQNDYFTELYLSNTTNDELCKTFNCTMGPIYKKAKELGLTRPKQWAYGEKSNGYKTRQKFLLDNKDKLEEIYNLRKNGVRVAEIARKYKVAHTTIKKWCVVYLGID